METAEVCFSARRVKDQDRAQDALEEYLAALEQNGQVLGSDTPIAQSASGYLIFVNLPEVRSLGPRFGNRRVRKALRTLNAVGLRGPKVRHLGPDPDGRPPCRCRRRSFFILFTSFLHGDPPVRCGECFYPVPLYTLPKTGYAGDYQDLLWWQATYQAVDWLHIGSGAGERYGHDQMARFESELSKTGREAAHTLARRTRRPVYYYLSKYYGRSDRQERARRCPCCDGAWLLDAPLHNIFDFRCDRCRLLSNIAWDVRA